MHVITFKQTSKIPFLRRKFQFAIHNPITINYFPSFLCFFLSSFSLPLSLKPSPHLIFEARHSATSQSLYLSNYLSMLFTNYLDRIQIPKPFAFLPIPSRSVRRMKTKHPLRSLLSPPSSPACNQRNQIPDFAFEIKRWRGKAIEMGNLEFVERQTCAN